MPTLVSYAELLVRLYRLHNSYRAPVACPWLRLAEHGTRISNSKFKTLPDCGMYCKAYVHTRHDAPMSMTHLLYIYNILYSIKAQGRLGTSAETPSWPEPTPNCPTPIDPRRKALKELPSLRQRQRLFDEVKRERSYLGTCRSVRKSRSGFGLWRVSAVASTCRRAPAHTSGGYQDGRPAHSRRLCDPQTFCLHRADDLCKVLGVISIQP